MSFTETGVPEDISVSTTELRSKKWKKLLNTPFLNLATPEAILDYGICMNPNCDQVEKVDGGETIGFCPKCKMNTITNATYLPSNKETEEFYRDFRKNFRAAGELPLLVSRLDAVADFLEGRGLIKEAYEIDKVANVLDK